MARQCPICRREVVFEGNPFRPFCSERCKLLDLDNWLAGRYRLAATVTESAGAAEAPPTDAGAKEKRG